MSTPDQDPLPPSSERSERAAGREGGGPKALRAWLDSAAPGERAGDRIGRYTLLEEIGEGGFGVVWKAEQKEPVRRTVALKVIKLGMDTRQVVARFEAERQALALMDHPHIARVIDGGATQSGRPYFVMELVQGASIVEYCDANRLSVAERLDLMAQVCQAVQHAHNKGLIHRDLKPSNVLVAMQDGRPQVKVIDFGIAKATAQTLTERTLFTEHGQVVGTLQYMSPEQAEGSLDIDTRTDVYSLGILLYELLAGSTPFDVRTLVGVTFGEVQRLLREVDPPRPSTRLAESAETLVGIAARRGIEPRRLSSLLRGELDWIVMKALEKERSRRYETPGSLALDLQRFRRGEAVEAAPPSAAYRLRKLVRRNRALVSATAAVGIALLAGLLAFAWQARVARKQRDLAQGAREAEARQRALAEEQGRRADEERERAVQAEREATARAAELALVADFQAGMLERIDATAAGRTLSEDVSARLTDSLRRSGLDADERAAQAQTFRVLWRRVNATDAARTLVERTLLAPAAAAIEAQLADQPKVAARLRQVLADRYRGLGLYEAALPLQTSALEARERLLGEEDPDTLTSMERLGLLLSSMGRYAEAESTSRRVLELSRRVLGSEDPATLDRITNLGTVLEARGKLDEAEACHREALETSRRVLAEDDPAAIPYLNNMGYLLESKGQLSEAESLYRETLESCWRILGAEHPHTLLAMGNMGALLHRQGRLDEAEPLYRQALETSREVLGEEHPSTLIQLGNLAVLLKFQGRLDEAEPLYLEALEKKRRVLGEEHPDTLIALNNVGALLWKEGKLAEAEPFFREAVEKKRRILGAAHPGTLSSTLSLAELLADRGQPRAVVELLGPVVEDARAGLTGDERPQLVRFFTLLGKAHAARGAYAAAEPALLEAHALAAGTAGVQDTVQGLVALYEAWERAEPGQGHGADAAAWKAKR